MRKVIAGVMMSLDGVMQAPGGPEEDPTGGFKFGGWVFPHFDEVFDQALDKSFGAPFDLLLGRKTYEIFAAHWPHVGADDPIGQRFNKVTKYVATTSKTPLTWQNSVALHDAARDVARLKQQDGPMLLTQGSSALLQSLLKADLIDEFRVSIFPVILGRGKRLFREGTNPAGLKLTESNVSTTGVTINTYVRAGDVKTGSFALQDPSKEELQRRERLKKEGRSRNGSGCLRTLAHLFWPAWRATRRRSIRLPVRELSSYILAHRHPNSDLNIRKLGTLTATLQRE